MTISADSSSISHAVLNGSIINSSGNDVGLPGLPSEILHEIVSHLPRLPFPLIWQPYPGADSLRPISPSEPRIARAKTLRALSATCRSLRWFALPLAWESIEILSCECSERKPKEWREDLARTLVKQLEVVTVVNPGLASCVKSISVLLADSEHIDTTYELARCLPLFPILDTVQFLGNLGNAADFADAIEGQRLPSIRRLVLPPFGWPLLKCCPNLQVAHAVLNHSSHRDRILGKAMLQAVVMSCPKIEELHGFPIDWRTDLDIIHAACPKLRVIPVQVQRGWGVIPFILAIEQFTQFNRLEHIVLDVPLDAIMTKEGDWYADIEDAIDSCIRMLGNLPVSDKITPTRYWPLVPKWVRSEAEITPTSLIGAPFPLLSGHSRQPPLLSDRMKGIKYLRINVLQTPMFIDVVIGPFGNKNTSDRDDDLVTVFYQKGQRTQDIFQEIQYTARPVITMKSLDDAWLSEPDGDYTSDLDFESDSSGFQIYSLQ